MSDQTINVGPVACGACKQDFMASTQVDRLARALASVEPERVRTSINRQNGEWEYESFCPVCHGVVDYPPEHDNDCAYVWAIEHVAALEDQ